MSDVIKKPSAWVPIAMSLSALALVIGYLVIFGSAHQEDEGTGAHLFQFFMAGQVPIIAFFVIRYLPKTPKQTLKVLALQFIAALSAFAPVFFLQW